MENNNKNIRLRFAPSPTGFLHLGNLRGALFAYLLARNLNGKYILRIEDTDQKREVGGAVESLIDILSWTGIKFDEGPHIGGNFGPYIQTERLDIYQKLIKELIDNDKAYYCFCTAERLTEMREAQQAAKLAPRYDRCCRDLSPEEVNAKIEAGEKYVIRQKLPLEGEIIVHDELRGDVKFNITDLEDHVLIKSDGIPTYQLANIVDDHLMEISHVTRGEEWLPSFPKNILLYQAFGWIPPKFIHLPLILNKTGGKLSKRQGDVFAEDYREHGYLKEAIVNFCALLGWHSKDDQEIYTLDELEKVFSLEGLGSSPAVFDIEKLDYFNGYYIRQKTASELIPLIKSYIEKSYGPQSDDTLEKVMALSQERLKKLEDVVEFNKFIFADKLDYEPALLIWKTLSATDIKNNLLEIKTKLEEIEVEKWQKEYLEGFIIAYIKDNEKKVGDYLWPLRVALTGEKNSPGPFEVAWALGKEKSLKRIDAAIVLL
jgi:glutamyl-tRNA synthetase